MSNKADYIQSRRDRGICIRCSRPPVPGHARCEACLEKKRLDHKRRRAQAKTTAKFDGKYCRRCAGLPHRVPGIRCPSCKLRFAHEPLPDIGEFLRRASGE